MIKKIEKQIQESIEVKRQLIKYCLPEIDEAARIMIMSIRNGGKILWCGNGGSASDAQHLSTELMGGMSDHDRKPIPSLSLTCLLYTSPSPRDATLSRMPSSA